MFDFQFIKHDKKNSPPAAAQPQPQPVRSFIPFVRVCYLVASLIRKSNFQISDDRYQISSINLNNFGTILWKYDDTFEIVVY